MESRSSRCGERVSRASPLVDRDDLRSIAAVFAARVLGPYEIVAEVERDDRSTI